MPSTTIDWTLSDGVADIPIEERSAAEVTDMTGRLADWFDCHDADCRRRQSGREPRLRRQHPRGW